MSSNVSSALFMYTSSLRPIVSFRDDRVRCHGQKTKVCISSDSSNIDEAIGMLCRRSLFEAIGKYDSFSGIEDFEMQSTVPAVDRLMKS